MAAGAGVLAEPVDERERRRRRLNLRADPRPLGHRLLARPARALRRQPTVAVLARQQPGRQRVVGHKADPELDAAGQELELGAALEQRVLVLERGDRRRAGRLVELLEREVRDADRPDLAGGDQLGHRGDCLADRRDLVGPVVVEQVDMVGLEPLERAVERAPDVARLAARGSVVAHVAAELRREHHLVAAAAQELAEHPLAPALAAVDIGRVEEGDAGGDGRIDDGAGAVNVDPAAEVVAAEPHARDPKRAQRHLLHRTQSNRDPDPPVGGSPGRGAADTRMSPIRHRRRPPCQGTWRRDDRSG